MHSLSVQFIAILWVIGVVFAAPLGIEYDKEAKTAAERANKARFEKATTDANAQITNMREGLTKYQAGEKKATKLFEAAFGKNADIDVVEKTVSALETGKLEVKLRTHKFQDDEIASVPWDAPDLGKKRKRGDPTWIPGDAQFSAQFHGKGPDPLNDAGRAGTIIHEATHQLMKTGDDVNIKGDIIKANDGKSKPSGEDGYTSNHNMHQTVAQVNADTKFTDVRDTAKNMHHNAESYAVFASLCSQPGALRRRDVHLYVRALLEGDDEQLYYLARDNECKLPPDYFAKKAAANKAATAGAHPASGDVHLVPDSKAATHPTTGAGVLIPHVGKVATVHDTKTASKHDETVKVHNTAPPVHDLKATHSNEHKPAEHDPPLGPHAPNSKAATVGAAHSDSKQAAHISPKSVQDNSHQPSPKMRKTRRR